MLNKIRQGAARTIKKRYGVKQLRRGGDRETPAFDLAYVRPRTKVTPLGPLNTPAVVIPGGPGLASVLPYRGFRRQAAADGLDVIMVEHRGVGLSRNDLGGSPLPKSAMWVEHVVDDIAAVLDHEGVEKAFIAGSSYGSYLASTFAARHPQRVAGLLLDSALQSAEDIDLERDAVRPLFWEDNTELAEGVRTLAGRGEDQRVLLDVVRAAYEFGGAGPITEMVKRKVRGRPCPAWSALELYAVKPEAARNIPFRYEFDIAGTIGFRQLKYAPKPDGLPMDPALTYTPLEDLFPGFVGEPYDLPEAARGFDFPVALLVGDRDLRTPPEIALRTANRAPDARVVPITNGHSALDTHPLAFEKTLKLLVTGQADRMEELAPQIDALSRRSLGDTFAKALEVASGYQ